MRLYRLPLLQLHTEARSASGAPPHDTSKTTRTPGSVAASKRKSAWSRTDTKRNGPLRPSNALGRTGALLENLVTEIADRLWIQQKLSSKICEMMFSPLFGCHTNSELCHVLGWDKNLPSRVLGALPKRSWMQRLRRLGLEVLVPLWRYAASKE